MQYRTRHTERITPAIPLNGLPESGCILTDGRVSPTRCVPVTDEITIGCALWATRVRYESSGTAHGAGEYNRAHATISRS
jgi:hypothetical protein